MQVIIQSVGSFWFTLTVFIIEILKARSNRFGICRQEIS